jgi:hypothetical protein
MFQTKIIDSHIESKVRFESVRILLLSPAYRNGQLVMDTSCRSLDLLSFALGVDKNMLWAS